MARTSCSRCPGHQTRPQGFGLPRLLALPREKVSHAQPKEDFALSCSLPLIILLCYCACESLSSQTKTELPSCDKRTCSTHNRHIANLQSQVGVLESATGLMAL
eukprot:927927-Amphidinium_carterae.1